MFSKVYSNAGEMPAIIAMRLKSPLIRCVSASVKADDARE